MKADRLFILVTGIAVAALFLLPAAATAQQIRTLVDGVSKEGRIRNTDYSLLLTFSEMPSPFVAEIGVKILDDSGKPIVDEYSEGPWFYADLPPGDYRVVATDKEGVRQGASFTIEGNRQKVVRLVWR